MENKYYICNQRTGKKTEVNKEYYKEYMKTWEVDKYYYPDIEDLRIGWEGEVNWARGYVEIFDKEVIQLKDEDGTYLHDLEEAIIALDDGYAQFRVSLFSIDDLIKEPGWYQVRESIKGLGENWTFSGIFNANDGTIYKATYTVAEYRPNSILEIWDSNFADRVYRGQCQDINDFRWICKMLRIK